MSSRYIDHDEPVYTEFGIDGYWHSPLVLLEVATRPLISIVDNLAASVAIAKQRCHKSSDGLTHDESAAIYLYTMETSVGSVYNIVNQHLRTNNSAKALPWFSYIKLLCTGLKKLPSHNGCVWRGVWGDVAKRYRKGTTVRWWSFTSCTTTVSVIQKFLPTLGQGTIFMVECVTGKAISVYSKHAEENEILLMPGIRLEAVDDSLSTNGMRVVHLKEIVPKASSTSLSRAVSAKNLHSLAQAATPLAYSKPSLKKEATMASMVLPPKSASPNKGSSAPATKKLNCPHCSTTLVFSGNYQPGGQNTCFNCKKKFNEVSCPHCHKSNVWKNNDYCAGKRVTCASCSQKFQHLNCPHCHRAAFWLTNEHIGGLRTTCSSCQGVYCSLNCPHCSADQYFVNDNYKSGLRYKCSRCEKTYQAINCPHCSILNYWKDANRKAGLKTKCYNCKKTFQHINCPHCSSPNVWENADCKPGLKITCHNCKNCYQHINCPHCQSPNIWRDGKYTQRQQVTCCNCNKLYQHVTCPHCHGANYFLNADLQSTTRVVCHGCSRTF